MRSHFVDDFCLVEAFNATEEESHFVQVVFAHSYSSKEQRPSRASLVINVPATGGRRREDAALSPLLLPHG